QLGGEECVETAFADDLLILVEADSRAELERLGQRALEMTDGWGDRVRVSVSEKKTVCMLLKETLSDSRPPCVKRKGHGIPYVKSVTYLGLTFGERFDFKPHFVRVREKILGLVGELRRVLRKEWGLDRRSFGVIYTV